MEKQNVTENGLRANFYQVNGKQRRVIICLGGSEGGLPFADHEAHLQALLDLGHPVLCLAYFGVAGLPQSLEKIPLEYFERAFDWLSRQPDIINEYAIIGGSKGGELALLLASRYSQVKAVIASVPSNVVWQGIPSGFPRSPLGSSWSYAGNDLPFVPLQFSPALIMGLITHRYRKAYEHALLNKKRVAQAIIPVEKIGGPVLLISGRKDTLWPSMPMCEQIVNRLAADPFPYPYQHVVIGEGHGVQNVETFWPIVTGFLREHFK
ncbi:MAG: dienelactone hydrolase [Chloroflexi bacterium]|nr:dienelactone hydrolase [Chloroflexota bacterium]